MDLSRARTEPISVVVCSRNRTAMLEGCLTALQAQSYAHFEVLVVDSGPADENTAGLCARFPVRYLRESEPGLSRARNRGIREAKHPIVAFTDDDTLPDPMWLSALAEAFADKAVMAVTGRVVAADLATPAQRYFELGAGGMSKGTQRLDFVRDRLDEMQLVHVQDFGVGANMAFRRIVFDDLGAFDPLLGAGTPARGAEDLDFFHRVVANGQLLRYEPKAIVRHRHRTDMSGLRQQFFDSGCGYGVYLLSLLESRTVKRRTVLRYTFGTWIPWLAGRLVKRAAGRHPLPASLLWAQAAGAIKAPFVYRTTRAKRQ